MNAIQPGIKIILSILFLICLMGMPYGYFQLVRFVALAGFSLLAYLAFKQKREMQVIIFILLALLFQPIFKISLGRLNWNIVDAIVAVGLIVSLFLPAKHNKVI